MKKALLSAVIIALAAGFAACGGGPGGKVLVTVGGEKITEGDLETISDINPRIKAQMETEFGKKKILDNLVEQELLYLASTKEGLQRDPLVKDKIDLYRRVIISQAYMDKKLEDAARKYYDEHKGEFEKLQLSDILIKFKKDQKDKEKRSEKEALDLAGKIKARIEGGEDFATVAKEASEDTMTSKRGGDLGFASKDEPRLIRHGLGPVIEKAFTMKVGEVAGPVKTEGGYHIITVTKGAELQPFDTAMQGILFKIRGNARNEILADLKNKYKVEYLTAKKEEPKETKAEATPAKEAKPELKKGEKAEPKEPGVKKPEAGSKKQEKAGKSKD